MKAAELYEQRDMLPEAVGILERVMEYEPYNEQLALRLMTLYERGGDRSRAIRFFNEFRNQLASNLEIYPGSAITQKYAELKAAPAAPEEPAAVRTDVPGLHVQTYCIRAVPCFWMADAVGKLQDAFGNDVPSGDRTQLRELEKVGIALMVHTTDPNITPARVAQVYGLQEENIHMVPAALQREAEAALDGTGETAAEMVSGGMAGSLHSLLSAQREYGLAKAISVLLVLSVLIGFAIITLLAYSGALSRVTWWSLGAYQLLWFIPTVLLGLVRKK